MTTLADAVLPLIRTRAEVYRWNLADAHGQQMHDAVDLLDDAFATQDPATVCAVTHKALASTIKVIARTDDSSGIIGDACRRLLDLHPKVAAAAKVPATKLIDWMMKFQFDGDVDYFEIDPVANAPALGEKDMAAYRAQLDQLRASLGAEPAGDRRWSSPHSHAWLMLEWNARRLAVYDRDPDAIIRTHARDRKVAAWLEDTAKAFEEIGEFDRAIDRTKQATEVDRGYQALKASGYWCTLPAEHRPDELLDAWVAVFRRWPSSSTAGSLQGCGRRVARVAGRSHRATRCQSARCRPVPAALARRGSVRLGPGALAGTGERRRLGSARERVREDRPARRAAGSHEPRRARADEHRCAALPDRCAPVEEDASDRGRDDQTTGVDDLIADLRETHRRRPRLQREFDRVGLP